jgi:hypothetical protein
MELVNVGDSTFIVLLGGNIDISMNSNAPLNYVTDIFRCDISKFPGTALTSWNFILHQLDISGYTKVFRYSPSIIAVLSGIFNSASFFLIDFSKNSGFTFNNLTG